MKRLHLHGGELSGIIIIVFTVIDIIVEKVLKTNFLKITPLINIEWLSIAAIVIGIILLVIGCIIGYISHEMFNKAVSTDGDVKHIMKNGVYGLIRHPFYLSLILLAFSLMLFFKSYILLLGILIVVIALISDAKKEEKILEGVFEDEYYNYQKSTGMFLPKIFKVQK